MQLCLPMQANGEQVTVDWANCVMALVLSKLGTQEAASRATPVLDRARTTQDPELLVIASVAVAEAHAGVHGVTRAREVLLELAAIADTTGVASAPFYPMVLPRLVRVACQSDDITPGWRVRRFGRGRVAGAPTTLLPRAVRCTLSAAVTSRTQRRGSPVRRWRGRRSETRTSRPTPS